MVGAITGESIKSAIALKIRSAFAKTEGDPPITLYPTIYKEEVVQNMILPSFFIWTMEVDQTQVQKNVYERMYQMNIRYHPIEEDLRLYENLESIALKLSESLTSIEVPIFAGSLNEEGQPIEDKKPVVGRSISHKITDGVLQFFVTYTIRGRIQEIKGPQMNEITYNNR